MKVVEVARDGSEVLDMAWACQRHAADEMGVDWHVVDVTNRRLDTVVLPGCDALLLRELSFLELIPAKAPVFLDLALPTELGPMCRWRTKLQMARRVYCYSPFVERALRDTGTGKIRVLAGPYVDSVPCTLPTRATVAVLSTSSEAQQVLHEVLQFRGLKSLDFDVVSPLRAKGAVHVESNLEAAERATLVVAPTDSGDMGQSHEGAILALATRKALATSHSQALATMAFPQGSYINVRHYSARSYVAAVALFFNNPRPYLSWPSKVTTDAGELPRLVCKEMGA